MYELRSELATTIAFVEAGSKEDALNTFAKNLGFTDYLGWKQRYRGSGFSVTANLCKPRTACKRVSRTKNS